MSARHLFINRTLKFVIGIGSLLVSNISLAGASHAYWIAKTHDNLNKIENYQATIEQSQSNSSIPVISQVLFNKPNNFHLTVSQPTELKGIEAGFNNHSILLHNPNKQQALKIDGLKSPTAASKLEQVKSIYWYNQEYYDQVYKPSINIADRLSVGLDFIAKDQKNEILKTSAFVDYHHSLFMQASYSFNSGVSSQFKHTAIEFNQPQVTLPSFKVPKQTNIAYWDFNRASLTDKQVKEKISSAIHWPKDKNDIWGFAQHQFYQQDNAKTAAGYFYNDAFFMIVITRPATKNTELFQGIPLILNDTPVSFSQFPSFADLVFEFNGIHYTLLSNIHSQSLINMAKEMLSQKKSNESIDLAVES